MWQRAPRLLTPKWIAPATVKWVGQAERALKGDKRTYQMDPANSDEALREELDLHESVDTRRTCASAT
jgi:hypothetical protein